MASFKLYLDTRSPRKDGTCPVKIAVNHKKSFLINLKTYVSPEMFIDGMVIIPDNKRRQDNINSYLQNWMVSVENTVNKLTLLGTLQQMTDKELKAALSGEPEKEDTPILFKDRYNEYIKGFSRLGTLNTYDNMYQKVSKFTDMDNLELEDINYSWLKDFERFMTTEKLSPNTQSIYIRNIRAIFNDAIDREIVPLAIYPFRRYKIPKEKTRKRSLTKEQLIQLRDYPCEEHQRQYRDIFMLSFYLCGINMVDLCGLTKIENGYITYRRAKTGRLYEIKAEPEAMEIIERYKGKDYLLNISDRYKDHRNYIHRINKNLKEIGEVKIVNRKNNRPGRKEKTGLFPELSTYWARHTWATIAASLNIPKETIAAALGHGGNEVTDIYINFDQKKVDRANRKVLDSLKK